MRAKIADILRSCRQVLLIDVGVFVVIGVSFLFTGRFAPQAYSDRLLWAGVGAILVGGAVGVLGEMGTAASSGSSKARAPSDFRDSPEHTTDVERVAAAHHRFAFRFWAVGLTCVAASALVGILFGEGF